MDDLLPKKITKEERRNELLVNAVNKAKEAVGEIMNFNELPLKETVEVEGEEVKLTKPKKNPAEEKVDALEGIRPEFGKEQY
tara:strand:- start:1816 stop:2061 length:246 start_codon:yes stop_codon:yes gene_type:complete